MPVTTPIQPTASELQQTQKEGALFVHTWLQNIVEQLVNNPDQINVDDVSTSRTIHRFQINIVNSDAGRLLGKDRRTINSIIHLLVVMFMGQRKVEVFVMDLEGKQIFPSPALQKNGSRTRYSKDDEELSAES